MLTTGVDMPTCRNIVLFKPIKSIVDFKQIIGRGTRLFTDKDKLWFTIIDYTGQPGTRQRLIEILGIDPRYVQAAPGPDAPPPDQADILLILGRDYQERWMGN